MSAHNKYSIVIRNTDDSDEIKRIIAEHEQFDDDAKYFVDEWGDATTSEGTWEFYYGMEAISRKYPEYRFDLYTDDEWGEYTVDYYLNGAHYQDEGEVVYPKFDPARLQEGAL